MSESKRDIAGEKIHIKKNHVTFNIRDHNEPYARPFILK